MPLTHTEAVGVEDREELRPADWDAAPGRASLDVPSALILRFARIGHDAGYPTADLEERVLALARAFAVTGAEVSATPTLVEVSLGSLAQQRSYSLRVRPTSVDLDAIARLDDLVQDVLDGRLDADGALAELENVQGNPLRRPWPIRLAAYGVAGTALMPVLGGGWQEGPARHSWGSWSVRSPSPRREPLGRSPWSRRLRPLPPPSSPRS